MENVCRILESACPLFKTEIHYIEMCVSIACLIEPELVSDCMVFHGDIDAVAILVRHRLCENAISTIAGTISVAVPMKVCGGHTLAAENQQ